MLFCFCGGRGGGKREGGGLRFFFVCLFLLLNSAYQEDSCAKCTVHMTASSLSPHVRV